MTKTTDCGICGGNAIFTSEEHEVFVGRRSAVVLDEFYRCEQCEEELYEPGQAEEAMRRAATAIRANIGLLQPEEVKAIRESLDLSQADFERLLRVGPKTVVRWERGIVFQNQATDVLLRAIRDFQGFAEYLAEQAGVSVPERSRRQVAPQVACPRSQYQGL